MIYFLEDDSSIREMVVYTLNSYELEAVGYERPSLFWKAMEKSLPSLVMLDLMLPEEDGLSVLHKLRSAPETARMPVLILTAKGSEYDKVIGLDSGADDYLVKPFGIMELVSRIKALLRRAGDESSRQTSEYTVGALYVNTAKHIIEVDGEDVALTNKEYSMLCLFLEHPGIVFNRDQLLNKIWGYSFDGESRTVDVHIRTLRTKLGVCGNLIETVRGIGYKFGSEKNNA